MPSTAARCRFWAGGEGGGWGFKLGWPIVATTGGGGFVGGLFGVENFVFQIDREIYHACCRYHRIFFGAFGASVFLHPSFFFP